MRLVKQTKKLVPCNLASQCKYNNISKNIGYCAVHNVVKCNEYSMVGRSVANI